MPSIEEEIIRLTALLNESPFDPLVIGKLHNLHRRYGIDFQLSMMNYDILSKISDSLLEYTKNKMYRSGSLIGYSTPFESVLIPPYYVIVFNAEDRSKFLVFDYGKWKKEEVNNNQIAPMFRYHVRDTIELTYPSLNFTPFLELSKKIKPAVLYMENTELEDLSFLDKIDMSIITSLNIKYVKDASFLSNLRLDRRIPNYFGILKVAMNSHDLDSINNFCDKNRFVLFEYLLNKHIDFSILRNLKCENINIKWDRNKLKLTKEQRQEIVSYIPRNILHHNLLNKP
jgi:hypothetical protein